MTRKPINAEHPITEADVGRKALRRDGDITEITAYGRGDYPVCTKTETGGQHWHDSYGRSCVEISARDLIAWADEATEPDLSNPDRIPFGDLPRETQEAMVLANVLGSEGFEVWGEMTEEWYTVTRAEWRESGVYRIATKPEPKTKPSINWDHVSPEFNWLAVDACGTVRLHKGKPAFDVRSWKGVADYILAGAFASYKPGTCAPEDSLVCRPGHEDRETNND